MNEFNVDYKHAITTGIQGSSYTSYNSNEFNIMPCQQAIWAFDSHNTLIKYFLIFSYFSKVKAPMCCGMNSRLSSVWVWERLSNSGLQS